MPSLTPDPLLALKDSSQTVTRAPKPPEPQKKSKRVHVCAPISHIAKHVPATYHHNSFAESNAGQGVDLMATTSFTLDLIDTKATAGSQASSVEDKTYATARARVTGTDSVYLTASEEVLAGNPCASSTRKKDQVVGYLSVQATRGCRYNSHAATEDGEAISND